MYACLRRTCIYHLYSQCPLEFLDVFLNILYSRVGGYNILYESARVCVYVPTVLHICVLSIDSTTMYVCVCACVRECARCM